MQIVKQFHTYIVVCSDGTYYTGKTIDLKKRLKQHNGEIPGGAKYTSLRRPIKLVYFESYLSFKEAILREIAIKKLPRSKKAQLVSLTPNS
jgi:putative endonuclease